MNTHKLFGDGITDAGSIKFNVIFKETRYFIYACSLNFTKSTMGPDLVFVKISFKDAGENVVLDNLPFYCLPDYANFIFILSYATALDIIKDVVPGHNGLSWVLYDIDNNGGVSRSLRTTEFKFAFTL